MGASRTGTRAKGFGNFQPELAICSKAGHPALADTDIFISLTSYLATPEPVAQLFGEI